MKKRIRIFFGFILCILLCACSSKEKQETGMYVYYLNADKNALIQEEYAVFGIEDALKKLEFHGVLTTDVRVEKFKQNSTKLELYFGLDYYSMDKGTEVLSRAAIVQTLTQIENVQFVVFYVGDQPLTDNNGHEIGMMRAEDFVQNTGSSIASYQTTDLTLYFADKDGQHLKKKKFSNVRYNVNTSIERLIVEQLMKGTNAAGYQSTIPKTATLLGVSVKEDICYVNLDSKFVSDSYDLNPEVTIYSIVNSLVSNSNISKVQILIDGVSDVMYKGTVDLARPLKGDEKLLKE